MSLEQVNLVLGRALLDKTFRSQLLENPADILKGFDLNSQEVEALKRINAEQFQALDQAFQARLGGANPDANQAANFLKFMKIEWIPDSLSGELMAGHPKLIPALDGSSKDVGLDPDKGSNFTNAWPSKVVPANPAATGISLPSILAIGAGAVVVVGVLASVFIFGGARDPEQPPAATPPITADQPDVIQAAETFLQTTTLEAGPESICLLSDEIHLCAAPAGLVVDQLEAVSDSPLMLPLTPQQAFSMIAASGGSPPGVAGFSVMMLAGPDTYRINLPDNSGDHQAILLADAQGNPYFGAASFFAGGSFGSEAAAEEFPDQNPDLSIAGTWQSISGPGTMTCAGVSMNIPSEPPTQVVFNVDGTGIVAQDLVQDSVIQITSFSDGTFSADVTTMVDGAPILGQLDFWVVSPDVIEGVYTGTFENSCVFERSITMNRSGSMDAASAEIPPSVPDLSLAEFSLEDIFNPGGSFIPTFAACAVFPDVCKIGPGSSGSGTSLISGWDDVGSDVFLPGTALLYAGQTCESNDQAGMACVPSPDQGDVFIPPYPADAGWGSKGIGAPAVVSVLDVNKVGVINGIFDLWMLMGVPQADQWDGLIDLNSDLVRVYTLDLTSGTQVLWEEIKVTYDAIDITTDMNRLFILYLFEDEAAAQAAPGN